MRGSTRHLKLPAIGLLAGALATTPWVGCAGGSSRSADRASASAGQQSFTFDEQPAGSAPAGWRIEATRAGRGGAGAGLARWGIVADASAPSPPHALAVLESRHGEDQTYNLCWTDSATFRDGRVSVRFTCISGEVDQGGGPIWRVQDRDNYYICRANPLESNFRVYKVVAGVRTQLASATVQMTPGRSGQWHLIEVEHVGDRIVCTLDGTTRIEAVDDALPKQGGIGVWTKADALAAFDDLSISRAATPSMGNN